MRNFYAKDLTIFDSASKLVAEFTAAATDIITSAAHGLKDGDLVHVATTTTLPTGLSASTDYYVIYLTVDTFKLSATLLGQAVDITAAGSGTHSFYLKGKSIMITDGRHAELSLHTAGSANFNAKVQRSQQSDVDFNAAASATNRWDYTQIIDIEDATPYNGDAGITFAGADDNFEFEVNTNAGTWLTVIVSSWVAGTLSAKLSIYD